MPYDYRDPSLTTLFEDMGRLVTGESVDRDSVEARLLEVARANAPELAEYWRRIGQGVGVPDTAFKQRSPYLFPDEPPVRTFSTSGTTGQARGRAAYSKRGLALMDLSIHHNARRHIIGALDSPAILRLVPPERAAPEMVMAYGMERIAADFGDPELSASVVTQSGVDLAQLRTLLDRAEREARPVVLIGGSFAYVNVCERLEREGLRWSLAPGSRAVDAGGFKGRSRAVDVAELRALIGRSFGITPGACVNLFGMTELASQLYDASDVAVGPLGERPKARLPFVYPRVRDAHTLALREAGVGLLEVVDCAVLDRPCTVLTGDVGVAGPEGVAITGRVQRGTSRGCSLTLDAITSGEAAHA
jgi:hypothetical protein